jgi:signal peptidase I
MTIRWFYSKAVREACAMRKHVRRLLAAQRDVLSPQAIGAMAAAMNELRKVIAEGANTGKIRIKTEELEFAANKWLKPYPHALWRENVEVLLVAIAVAMGIRTFFLQPFKIPTGSMQPTLFGVTSKNLLGDTSIPIPDWFERVKEWIHGTNYVHVVAETDGELDAVTRPWPPVVFSIFQRLEIGGQRQTIWFPPDYGEMPLENRAGLELGHFYHKGDDVVKLQVNAGDHLFVDRLTYNFRKPERGEIVVFATTGIDRLPPGQQNTFYIKRLVGLGGEDLRLKPDYAVTNVPRLGEVLVGHLVVNGHELNGSMPHFENVYSYSNPPRGAKTLAYVENHYYGHALIGELEPGRDYAVPPHHLFVLGDNTMNSLDSRFWGDFPNDHVIGKSFFVYWPISRRFGWGNQ